MDLYPQVKGLTLTRREEFNKWFLLKELIDFGPEWFRQFSANLKDQEVLVQVPLVKCKQFPLPVMDINPSTAGNNINVIDRMLLQGRIGAEDVVENGKVVSKGIGDHVVLILDNLLSIEHMLSGQRSRSIEETLWDQKGFIVPVMGLFHLKMACADAIWRVYIFAKLAKYDQHSLINHIEQIRPQETGKFQSKPTFHQMHEAIQHVGRAMRMVLWGLEVKRQNPKIATLEDFAKRNPTWDELCKMAEYVARNKVAGNEFSDQRQLKPEERDLVHENMLL